MTHNNRTSNQKICLERSIDRAWDDMSQTMLWIDHLLEDFQELTRIKHELHKEMEGLRRTIRDLHGRSKSSKAVDALPAARQLTKNLGEYRTHCRQSRFFQGDYLCGEICSLFCEAEHALRRVQSVREQLESHADCRN